MNEGIHSGWPALRVLLLVLLAAGAGSLRAETVRPYDEKADAAAAIAAAIAGNSAGKPVLLTFGGNWCKDSRALGAFYREPEIAALLAEKFVVVHVDVGMFHRNPEIVARYGNPIDKGIPSVVLLDRAGATLYVEHGRLSSAHALQSAEVLEYFRRLAADGRID